MHHQRTRPAPGAEPFLLTNQVADLPQVSPNIVARWDQQGRLPHQRILGGHRRYPTTIINQLAASLVQEVRAA
jgi:predicted site-specific integrase-resolvase